MRGLDIRVRYAQAKVVNMLGLDAEDVEIGCEVARDAEALGYYDYEDGRSDLPTVFQGEPELINAWVDGWNSRAALN